MNREKYNVLCAICYSLGFFSCILQVVSIPKGVEGYGVFGLPITLTLAIIPILVPMFINIRDV